METTSDRKITELWCLAHADLALLYWGIFCCLLGMLISIEVRGRKIGTVWSVSKWLIETSLSYMYSSINWWVGCILCMMTQLKKTTTSRRVVPFDLMWFLSKIIMQRKIFKYAAKYFHWPHGRIGTIAIFFCAYIVRCILKLVSRLFNL